MIIVNDDKFKYNSYTSRPRVGLDGDVDGVGRKTSPAQEEATKVGPKICNTTIEATPTRLTPPT